MHRIWPNHFNSRRACDLVLSNPVCLLCLYEAQAERLTLAVTEDGQWQGNSDSAALHRGVQLLYRENLIEPQRDYCVAGRAGYALTNPGRWLLGVLQDSGWTPRCLQEPPATASGAPVAVPSAAAVGTAAADTDGAQDATAGADTAYSAVAQAEIRVLRKILRTKGMANCLLACPAQGCFTLPMLGEDADCTPADTAHLRQMLLFFTRNAILRRHRLLKRYSYSYELTAYGDSIRQFFRDLLAGGDFPDPA